MTEHALLESLRQSEERFRLLVESIRDYAVFLLDTGGRVVSWNAGAQRIKQWSADEIVGSPTSRFYTDEDIRAGKPEALLAAAEKEGRVEDEGWRVRKDGSRLWADVVITALRDADGRLVGFAKITRDLTERRRAEEERILLARTETASKVKDELLARESEQRAWFETVLQSIGDAVIATDERGNVTIMNPVAEALTGWKAVEALAHPLGGVFHIVNEATRRLVENPVDRVLREGVVVGLANHTLLVSRDGTEYPIADSGAPIRDTDGNIRGVVLVFRDATEQQRESSQRAFLAEATAILSSSLDYKETIARVAQLTVPHLADWCSVEMLEDGKIAQVAVAHVDPTKVKLAREWNRRFPPDPNAPTGTPNILRTGKSELYEEITEQLIEQAIENEEQRQLARDLKLRSALAVPLRAGDRVIRALSLIYAESGRRYTKDDVAFAEEVARRAGVSVQNARLFAAEQRAREAADLASRTKDEFLASVSHELRTPLSAILGWARLLAGTALDEGKRGRAVETIERNAQSMAQLIEDLLDVSRIVSGKMRVEMSMVELRPVIEAAIDAVAPAARAKSIRIEQELEPDAGPVRGDASRLQQVVWNLLSNAVKFTPNGGRVSVSLRPAGPNVEIVVSDTGRGLDPRFLPHAFDPFRQAEGGSSRSSAGLGLGLAIVRHLVEAHGGDVEARSEGVGRGATFVVRLPIPSARDAAQAGRSQPFALGKPFEPQRLFENLRVLVVEDDADTRDMIVEVLSSCGAVVAAADSVEEAEQALARETPDVVLSDIGMPGPSGYDFIRNLRALPPERGGRIPAAALTAYTRAEDRRRALDAGYQMHVPKPIDPQELCAVVAALARFGPR